MTKFLFNSSPNTLLIFIDETGVEDLSDPNNPGFGRAGCAVLSRNYDNYIRVPWENMKDQFFDGKAKLWHTNQIKFLPSQIEAVNHFVNKPFLRFGHAYGISNKDNISSASKTAHSHISNLMVNYNIPLLVNTIKRLDKVACDNIIIIFESSNRLDKIVLCEFPPELIKQAIFDKSQLKVNITILFETKKNLIAGLEVADLVAHTLGGANRKFMIRPGVDVPLDFYNMFVLNKKTAFLQWTNDKFPLNRRV